MNTDGTTLSLLAEQNDAFRRCMAVHDAYKGRLVGTATVASLPQADIDIMLRMVRDFDSFTPGNDPEGAHDFGCIEHSGRKWFFKIDCFDGPDCEYGSEEPTDPAQTYRVLTIMAAEEY